MPALPPLNSLAEKVHALAGQLSPAHISVAKEIPALVAREITDNEPLTVALLSSEYHWYTSTRFWVIGGIIGGLLLIGGICACAAGHGDLGAKIAQADEDGVLAAYRQAERDAVEAAAKERVARANKADQEDYWRRARCNY
ncbi:hypothetical protein FIE12Z_10690 [Fusarium flagelliforme]|uniref:Uncharacterized protein n=1 Tax=Fusarium flagelliforme TaxID=2675880 RepID=A0A395MAY3_9HYPO|nr:hypothetical protein FIE12Z_10690 [Fusarium flagelliforme]